MPVTENNIKTHSFEYFNSSSLPNKTSLSQDYWGFYNGAPNKNSFIPELRDSLGNPLDYAQFTPASRVPSLVFAKYFNLKKITYPTKGSTEFDYELNTYDPTDVPGIITPSTVSRDERASANEATPNNFIVIRPNPNTTLHLDYSVVLRGWNQGSDPNNPLPKPNLNSSDFTDSFYVTLEDLNGNVLVKKHIPSSEGNTLWAAYDPVNSACGSPGAGNNNCSRTVECDVTGTNYCDSNNCTPFGQPAIIFQCSEDWQYNNPIAHLNLTEDEYVLRAHFDDKGGTLYGQAFIRARWEDVSVDPTQQYAVGGGLRVKSIVDRDIDGTQLRERNFKYHYLETVDGVQVEKSYGKLKTIPNHNASHRTVYLMKYLFTLGLSNYWGLESMPKVAGNASSQNSFSKDAGSYVGYDQVETTFEGSNGDNGKIVKYFFNEEDLFREALNIPYRDDYYKFPPLRVPHNGVTLKEENFKREGTLYTLVSETSNGYEVNGLPGVGFDLYNLYQNPDRLQSAVKENPVTLRIEGGLSVTDCSTLKFQFHHYFSNLVQQVSTSETIYDTNGNNAVTRTEVYDYENATHLQQTKVTTTESNGTVLETKTYFPDDIASANDLPEGGSLTNYVDINQLKAANQHQVAIPIQKVTYRDGELLNLERTEFNTYGQFSSPRTSDLQDIILANAVKTAKGELNGTQTTALEDRVLYEDYKQGKPIQMRKADGSEISFIWGYDNTYPIAKIENASYDDLASALGVSVSALKSYDEGNLNAINGLRTSHPEFMVSTFTYEPLRGMTSSTDPRGIRQLMNTTA